MFALREVRMYFSAQFNLQGKCSDTELYIRHDPDDLGFSVHPLSYVKYGTYVG